MKPGFEHTTLDHQDFSQEHFFNLLGSHLKTLDIWILPEAEYLVFCLSPFLCFSSVAIIPLYLNKLPQETALKFYVEVDNGMKQC